ncbi:sensor histidine kinase [Flavilitoribacter nigricans]|uniref:histidine kinase n=1 Tax=Flavilitoribacter nigricans (strain ATCC 23147 / DSM 23189 / NBRC 102662 / NCIMB 1420 / SS-2) TaxID=1122177 RepID=A0A2D0N2Q3_FLAN2|nr:sensor histidine kinase [Flavilitoribacter nigricans]PHN02727.1 hypothetical protein CRP01_30555 [Flavilitoribacter nigricans DSM 23189 = NBRC 102662]
MRKQLHLLSDGFKKPRSITLALSYIFLILLVVLAIFFYIQTKAKQLDRDYQASTRVEVNLSNLLSNLQDAETGQRGYLLTQDRRYLGPFYLARASNLTIFKEIFQDIDVNSVPEGRKIKDLTARKYDELEATIELTQQERLSEALQIVETDAGQMMMDSLRILIHSLREKEKSKLAFSVQKINRLYLAGNIVFVICGITILGALVYVFRFIHPRLDQLYQTNKALKEHQIVIESKNEQLEHFAYITSHDIREPLKSIKGFVELFEVEYFDKLDHLGKQSFQFIKDAADRMDRMITTILNFSNLGKSEKFEEVDLNTTIQKVEKDLNVLIQENNAEIRCENLPLVVGKKELLKLLYHNLIANAIKFKQEALSPKIDISWKEDDRYWTFFVKDNGIGIPEKHHATIFRFFSRLHQQSTFSGYGIGLAFCKRIVELHDGHMTVSSHVDQGTTFSFQISKHLDHES